MPRSDQADSSLPRSLRFLSGGGEAARLILERDWTGHPLGKPETWPEGLKVALSLLLNERDDTAKAYVKALRPVGTDEGPEVECDFTSGEYRFTYRKRWLKNKETKWN